MNYLHCSPSGYFVIHGKQKVPDLQRLKWGNNGSGYFPDRSGLLYQTRFLHQMGGIFILRNTFVYFIIKIELIGFQPAFKAIVAYFQWIFAFEFMQNMNKVIYYK
ncbi:MAG: hypothetical protein M5Z89_11025 [Olivibacter sp.]|nr:hypothetical protein [Olivibacter sp. UJ_SKK_5.1]